MPVVSGGGDKWHAVEVCQVLRVLSVQPVLHERFPQCGAPLHEAGHGGCTHEVSRKEG